MSSPVCAKNGFIGFLPIIIYGIQRTPGKLILAKRYLITFLVMVNKHCGWRGSKNEWIPSKYNLEHSFHFYF